MPEIINCPSCRRKLQVPETLLGQDVQCPTCNATFVASVGSSAPPRHEPTYQAQEPPPLPAPDDYDDYGDVSRRRRRRDLAPHRGTTILVLGILSIVACQILGPIAWVMGNSDLAEMAAGRMDPEGESTTNAGRICGIIGTATLVLWLGFVCCMFALGMSSSAARVR